MEPVQRILQAGRGDGAGDPRRLDQFPMPEVEEYQWRLCVQMNAYGVKVDSALIDGALYIDQISTGRLTEEAIALTGLEKP